MEVEERKKSGQLLEEPPGSMWIPIDTFGGYKLKWFLIFQWKHLTGWTRRVPSHFSAHQLAHWLQLEVQPGSRRCWQVPLYGRYGLLPLIKSVRYKSEFKLYSEGGKREIGNIFSSGRKIAPCMVRLNVIGRGEAAPRVKATDSRWTVSQVSFSEEIKLC